MWKEEEEILLIDNYSKKSKEELLSMLPGKTWGAISRKAFRMGILKIDKKWDREEVDILNKYYTYNNTKDLVGLLKNKSISSIEKKANRLGLKKDSYNNWDEFEINFLKENYQESTKDFILSNLKNKSWDAVLNKALRLGLKRSIDIQVESRESTNLEKYGTKYYILSQDLKNKNLIEYGVEYLSQTSLFKEKSYNTKKINNSFNKSAPELDILEILKSNFDKVSHQYNEDPRYPFNCDYYIHSLDLFIEFQGNWTHGAEPYNGNNLDPSWVEKAKESEFYKKAIEVYTISDPIKRKIALNQNLNYLEIWYSDYLKGESWILSLIKNKSSL